jgi:hypothetical protein
MRKEEVFDLLGPEQFGAAFREPEFDENDARYNALVEARPDRYPAGRSPGDHYWAKWTDPMDVGKWVAVLFMDGRVQLVLKKGF